MLYNDERLNEKPFLYYAYHDMQGISIFQTLKYGSKNSAWPSASMVCPGLQYVGPTKQDLLDTVEGVSGPLRTRLEANTPQWEYPRVPRCSQRLGTIKVVQGQDQMRTQDAEGSGNVHGFPEQRPFGTRAAGQVRS